MAIITLCTELIVIVSKLPVQCMMCDDCMYTASINIIFIGTTRTSSWTGFHCNPAAWSTYFSKTMEMLL